MLEKERYFKTKTGDTWKYTKGITTNNNGMPIIVKIECDRCSNFIPKENIKPHDFLGLQEVGDIGICIRKDPNVKIVTVSHRNVKNCNFF